MIFTVEDAAGGFAVCQGGNPLKTPAGKPLAVPSRALAEAIAQEKPGKKPGPLLQLALTSIDIVAEARDKAIADITAYAGSELLCHRAEHPPALAKRQEEIWQPLLDWFAETFDAPLQCGAGVMPIAQPPASLESIRKRIAACDAFRLTGLSRAVHAGGSLVLGLALAMQHLSADDVSHAAELDANQQMKDWGDDAAIRERIEAVREELNHCERWFKLLLTNNR